MASSQPQQSPEATGEQDGYLCRLGERVREERARRVEKAGHRLRAAGAHFVIDNVAELEPVIEEVDWRLHEGERP